MKENNILTLDLDYIQNSQQEIKLLDIFLKKIKTCEKIIFIKAHHQILEHIYKLKKINLFNVDHHHDIFYSADVALENQYREGNWILYLLKHNLLESYTWICNFDSDLTTDSLHPVRHLKSFYHTPNLDLINKFEYKYIIVCESMDYSKKCSLTYEMYKVISNNLFYEKVIENTSKNFTSHIIE
jgi:hypothetical protein